MDDSLSDEDFFGEITPFMSFKEALQYADKFNKILSTTVAIRRNGQLWDVITSSGEKAKLENFWLYEDCTEETENSYSEESDDQDKDYPTDEFFSDQENWARSNSDGWFYED